MLLLIVKVAPVGIPLATIFMVLPSISVGLILKLSVPLLLQIFMVVVSISVEPAELLEILPIGGLLLQLLITTKVISRILVPTKTPFLYSSTCPTTKLF